MSLLFGSILFCLVLAQVKTEADFPIIGYYQPEQVHLALGPEENSMTVTWSTFNETGKPAYFNEWAPLL